jgi:hypothetical protein
VPHRGRFSVEQARTRQYEPIFFSRKGLGCLGVTIVHGFYRIIENTNGRTEFVLLEVKVPIVFLGTVGFSLRTDGRYCIVNTIIVAEREIEITTDRCRTF